MIVDQIAAKLTRTYSVRNGNYKIIKRPTRAKLFKNIEEAMEITKIQPRVPDIAVMGIKGRDRDKVMAIEVKYFRKKKRYGAYEGIGQAVSLLLYGFDHVSLFQVYSSDLDDEDIRRGELAWATVRLLNLPLDFTFWQIVFHKNRLMEFRRMRPRWRNYKVKQHSLVNKNYKFRWKHPNPLRYRKKFCWNCTTAEQRKIIRKHMKRLQVAHKILMTNIAAM